MMNNDNTDQNNINKDDDVCENKNEDDDYNEMT